MTWLWCLASFIVGMTCGAGLIVGLIMAGTPIRQRSRDEWRE